MRSFINSIKKIWYWFPIIWKDRDWDQYYIYEVLKHKLKAQAKYISNKNRHTRAQQDAKRMTTCAKLIQICQDDTYDLEYTKYFEQKVDFQPCQDKKGFSQVNIEMIKDNFDDYFKKYPLIYKRVLRGEGRFTLHGRDKKEIRKIIAMNIAHINQDRARKLLFKIMESEIESWWD